MEPLELFVMTTSIILTLVSLVLCWDLGKLSPYGCTGDSVKYYCPQMYHIYIYIYIYIPTLTLHYNAEADPDPLLDPGETSTKKMTTTFSHKYFYRSPFNQFLRPLQH